MKGFKQREKEERAVEREKESMPEREREPMRS